MFWLGLFVGGIVGFFTAAILAASGRASRAEEGNEFVYRGGRGENE